MQGKFGSMLLGGAMRMALAAAMAAPLAAQKAPPAAPPPNHALDIAVFYNAGRSAANGGSSFWMQGGGVEVHGRFYRGLGAVADVAAMRTANIDSSGVGLDMVTATFGPRYTWPLAPRRYALFGQMLAGEAFGFNSVFPSSTGANTVADSLAVEAGGGLNVNFSPYLALRAFQANWLRTQLPNATTSVQNNLELRAGLIFRFR